MQLWKFSSDNRVRPAHRALSGPKWPTSEERAELDRIALMRINAEWQRAFFKDLVRSMHVQP